MLSKLINSRVLRSRQTGIVWNFSGEQYDAQAVEMNVACKECEETPVGSFQSLNVEAITFAIIQ